jgi:peptidoglycan hydrolase CwlO-like protein
MSFDFSKVVPDKAAVILAIVTGVGGWAVHAFSLFNLDQTKLDEHTAQIQHLQQGQKETHEALNNVAVTLARVDGKIDVLSQKIDDDRAQNAKAQARHGSQ